MLLAATGLLGACASEEEARVTGEPVPIRLSTAVEGSQTRTATTSTTGDTELLDGQTVDAYIKVKGGDWLAQPKICTVTGTNGDLTYSGDVFYPMDGTPVSIYAVHPSYTSAATFSVKSDQTDDANYAASDLSYCKTADYNRSESKHTLTFGHVLSKIIVNVQTNLGTVSSVKLRAKKSTTLTYPVDNGDGYTLGTASDVGIIKMNDGGAAIIPPQTTTAEGDVRIIVDIDNSSTFVYNIPASTTFASNTQYAYTISIGATISVTSSITPWGGAATPEHTYTGYVTPIQVDIKKNPLWYMAEYNVDYTPASGTAWDNGAGTFSFATSDNAGYFFTWNDAMKYFSTAENSYAATPTSISAYTTGTGSRLSGWHMPVQAEIWSILPVIDNNMWSYDAGSGTYKSAYIAPVFGYNSTTKTGISESSYFKRISATELHAIRFLGTDYCSAWKYELLSDNGGTWSSTNYGYFRVSATLIDKVDNSESAATNWYNTYWSCVPFGNDESEGAVRRVIYARGHNSSGTNSSANNVQGTYAYYLTGTEYDATHVWNLAVVNDRAVTHWNYPKTGDGRSVRLFKDVIDPGKPMASVSASDVGKVLAANGEIYPTVAIANYWGAIPCGIIAYVGSSGSVDASSSTYKCLVIGLEDANSGNTCTWYTASNGTCVSQTDNISTAVSLKNGIACTETLVNSNGTGVTTNCSGHTHNAATYTRNYSTTIPSGASSWFLPSIGQWQLIVQGLTGGTSSLTNNENNTYKASNVNTKITAAGGTGFQSAAYWSSTETNSTNVYRLHFSYGAAYNDSKSNEFYIRPVLAF